jgi:hypothetical protein
MSGERISLVVVTALAAVTVDRRSLIRRHQELGIPGPGNSGSELGEKTRPHIKGTCINHSEVVRLRPES